MGCGDYTHWLVVKFDLHRILRADVAIAEKERWINYFLEMDLEAARERLNDI